jgi:hypothetical protein
MFANGQGELFHALHYAFLNKMPPNYDEQKFTFECAPEDCLPQGGFSPVTPFCVHLHHTRTDSRLMETLKTQMRNESDPERVKVATFLVHLCGPDSSMKLGLKKDHSSYALSDARSMLLAGADILHKMVQDQAYRPQNLASMNNVRVKQNAA